MRSWWKKVGESSKDSHLEIIPILGQGTMILDGFLSPHAKKTKDDMGSVFVAPYCRIVCIKLIHVPPIYHHGSLEFFKTGKYLSTCHVLPIPYCWWKTSCTTWHVWNPVNNGINYLSTGAGLFPSTVSSNEGCPHEPHGFWLVDGSSFAASFLGSTPPISATLPYVGMSMVLSTWIISPLYK